jgi:hypothetical protein
MIAMITPINMDRFRDWAIKQTYYHMFDLIKGDFMGRSDCRAVHGENNILTADGSILTYTTARGGQATLNEIKSATYRTKRQLGDTKIGIAEETGQFQG